MSYIIKKTSRNDWFFYDYSVILLVQQTIGVITVFHYAEWNDFNEIFKTEYSLRIEVCRRLRDWGTSEASPPAPEVGICFNLKLLYPDYTFGKFVCKHAMNWSLHKHNGLEYTNLPVCDRGHERKWDNPARLDLCLFLADVLETNQLRGTPNV